MQESMLADHFVILQSALLAETRKEKTNLEHFSILVKTTHRPLQKGSGVLSPATVPRLTDQAFMPSAP